MLGGKGIRYMSDFFSSVITAIQNSHDIYWNGNYVFLTIYIVCLTILFAGKSKNTRGQRFLFLFSVFALIGICYNPLIHVLFLKMPQSSEAVYGRIWIFLPVWLVIAFACSAAKIKKESPLIRNCSYVFLAVGIALSGFSSSSLGYYIDSGSYYKTSSEGQEIADIVLSFNNNNPASLLLFCDEQEKNGNYVNGGSSYYGLMQYTGNVGIVPIFYDEQYIQSYYLSEVLPDGETKTQEYIDYCFIKYRRLYDFSYVVLPHDNELQEKMLCAGYQYVGCTSTNDVYKAIPKWCVQSFSGLLENNKKIYVISDNMGHFIVVGGGSMSDRSQMQQILNYCGNHVDAWIIPSLSADDIEGVNCIAMTDGYTIDDVYIPNIDVESVPNGFMSEQDRISFEKLVCLSNEGLFEIHYVTDGDEYDLYGMDFQGLSDMVDITTGSVTDNSMLFKTEICGKSFLFCSYIGYEQGQIALKKYGNNLDSDYVQIASGSGDGLGMEFYSMVSPDIAFCDSIRDDAGLKTYDCLNSLGVTCYCLENGDPSWIIIE